MKASTLSPTVDSVALLPRRDGSNSDDMGKENSFVSRFLTKI